MTTLTSFERSLDEAVSEAQLQLRSDPFLAAHRRRFRIVGSTLVAALAIWGLTGAGPDLEPKLRSKLAILMLALLVVLWWRTAPRENAVRWVHQWAADHGPWPRPESVELDDQGFLLSLPTHRQFHPWSKLMTASRQNEGLLLTWRGGSAYLLPSRVVTEQLIAALPQPPVDRRD